MDWVSGVLSLVCLAVVLLHLVRLALPGDGSALGELSHAVMALGMAAMFSPLGDPLPAPVWTVAYLLCGAWFAAVAIRTRSPGGDAAHHVVGSAAMLFMLSQHAPAAADAPAGAEHAGHAAHGGGGGGLGLVSLVAILLAGYFAWHALRCADRLRAGAPVVGDVAVVQRVRLVSVRSPQTVALAHVVMAVAMTVMLLAMV